MKVTILQYKSIIIYNEINKVQQIATIEKHIDIQIIHSLPTRGPLKAARKQLTVRGPCLKTPTSKISSN